MDRLHRLQPETRVGLESKLLRNTPKIRNLAISQHGLLVTVLLSLVQLNILPPTGLMCVHYHCQGLFYIGMHHTDWYHGKHMALGQTWNWLTWAVTSLTGEVCKIGVILVPQEHVAVWCLMKACKKRLVMKHRISFMPLYAPLCNALLCRARGLGKYVKYICINIILYKNIGRFEPTYLLFDLSFIWKALNNYYVVIHFSPFDTWNLMM